MLPKISVIIPVYNVENFLSKCIEDLLQQTYHNLEIILVNDGSTDSSPAICRRYAASDKRIKLINKTNGGLSDARNAGIHAAAGIFIAFVDSDDRIAPDFIEILYKSLESTGADIAECSFLKFSTDEELELLTETAKKIVTPATVVDKLEGMKLLLDEQLKQVVWNKLYRTSVLGSIFFPVGKLNEDEYWTYRVLYNADKIAVINNKLYFYRQQAGSIMGQKYSLRRLDGLRAYEERIAFMKRKLPQLQNLAIKKYCLGAVFHYKKLMENPDLDANGRYRKEIMASIRKYNRVSVLKQWHWKEIGWHTLFVYAPETTVRLRRFLYKDF